MTHELPVLRELLLLAAAALAVLLLFQRLRLPAIAGFIITGVLMGPGGFGLVRDTELVQTMAEFGVVLLLFTVGLEFSLADLRRLGRTALLAGALQVALTLAAATGLTLLLGLHPARAVFFGLLVSLSSTALVFKLLTDRVELHAPHGRLATAVLIFQDLMVIPFAIAVPYLGRWYTGAAPASPGPETALRSWFFIAALALAFVASRRALPWVMARVSRSRSREAFLFGVLLVALGSAYLSLRAGLSPALGAFLAGLILAESDLRSQIAADVLPFREAFSSVFFVTIGMLLETRVLLQHPLLIAASTLGLVLFKATAATLALRGSGAPWRVAAAAGMALAQVGEFSFVLAQSGAPGGLLGALGGQAFLAGSVFSMLLTPLLVARAPEWALAVDLRLTGQRAPGPVPMESDTGSAPHSTLMHDHVVIAGFGLNGRNVARVLRSVRLPHVVVDLDAESLQAGAAEGSRVVVGDITQALIQKQAGVPRARVLVLALSDPSATRHAARIARSLSREVFIVVRTRYVAEIDQLYRLGANQVIPEEFETSIEIFTAALRHYHVPMNVVQAQIQLLRQERYSLLRGMKLPGSVVEQLDAILQKGTCDTFLLLQHSPAVGRGLDQLSLSGKDSSGAAGARAVAVVRGGRAITAFEDGFTLRVGDTLVLAGTHAEMERAFERLSPPSEPVA